jgi:hypothetical protein
MRRTLVPRLLIDASTEACAPWPTATMAITAPTPIMMPSMVRRERSLFRMSASKEMRMISRKFKLK